MFARKYKEEIEQLKRQIESMKWEQEEEKKCYDKETEKRIIEQKIEWVIGSIKLTTGKVIKRPMYSINQKEASTIAKVLHEKLKAQGIISETWSNYSDCCKCYRVCVKIIKGEEND